MIINIKLQNVTVIRQLTDNGLFILVILFLHASLSIAQNPQNNWQWKNRLQLGVDYDSNVAEARLKQKSDGLSKFIYESQAKLTSQSYLIHLQYHGGLQYYFQTSAEHKMTHDVGGTFMYQLPPKIRFGTRLWGRLKYFSGYDWHYFIKSSELFFIFNVLSAQLTSAYENEGLNYLNYHRFNFSTHHFYLALARRLAPPLTGQLKSGYRLINFQRNAISPISKEIYIDYLDFRQQDDHYYFSIQGSLQKKVLSNLEYQFSRNLSNSYGFSYREHRLTLSLVCPLHQKLLLRIYGGLQRKKYDEALNKIIVTEFDTEREISNFFITDFSTDLSDNLSLLFRYSWYNNESPVPGRYYQKT
ncbi:hypothetical protein L0Z72_01425, partial [candidate division KSB1 bacterium]|nr:hypothetical protein [candidate division KSB1 bacterium]